MVAPIPQVASTADLCSELVISEKFNKTLEFQANLGWERNEKGEELSKGTGA